MREEQAATPGPWTFGYYGCNGYCINGGGQHIATSILYKKYGGAANARLIAAAPDMLHALQMLADWADKNVQDPAVIGPLGYARAAIAKATGEAP